MRPSLVALVTFAGLFSSVYGQTIPACALTCLTAAPAGSCLRTDNACLCRNPEFLANATQCITATCQGPDFVAAQQAAQAICLSVGVTLSPSPSGTVAAPSASATARASSSAPPAASATKKSGATVDAAHGFAAAIALGMAVLALAI